MNDCNVWRDSSNEEGWIAFWIWIEIKKQQLVIDLSTVGYDVNACRQRGETWSHVYEKKGKNKIQLDSQKKLGQ